jgi:opacity protein-like surface antigen
MRRAVFFLVLALVPMPAAASEIVLTPYVGRTFNGDATEEARQYGASLSFGSGTFGFELDGSYTPDFFGAVPAFSALDEERPNNVTTLMGNVVLGPRFSDGRGRIYVLGGAGLMKTRVEDRDDFFDVDRSDFGVSAGGGLMFFFNDRLGLRGDVRYFRDLRDPADEDEFDLEVGDFDYWRGGVGLSLRF